MIVLAILVGAAAGAFAMALFVVASESQVVRDAERRGYDAGWRAGYAQAREGAER